MITRIALAGAVIAGAISAVCAISNYVGGSQHDQNVIALEKKIALLGGAPAKRGGLTFDDLPDLPASKRGLPDLPPGFVLEPVIPRVAVEGPPAELVKAYQALGAERGYSPMWWPYYLSALIVLITSVLPWLWYFLLRRIRELSTAIRGG